MLWSFDCWRLKSILGVCGCWYQPNSVLCSVSSEGGLAKVGEGWVEQQEVKSISYSIKISHSLSGIGSTFENLHLHISAHRYTSMSLHASRQSLVQPFPFSADNALVILFFLNDQKRANRRPSAFMGPTGSGTTAAGKRYRVHRTMQVLKSPPVAAHSQACFYWNITIDIHSFSAFSPDKTLFCFFVFPLWVSRTHWRRLCWLFHSEANI